MSIVVDASMALAWSFDDERTPTIEGVLNRVIENGAVVPGLWRLEVANSLRSAIKRGRIDREFRDETLQDLSELPIQVDPDTSSHAWSATLGLSDRYGLTPYEAAYLELAQRRRIPLATLDAALALSAAQAGVELIAIS